MRSTVAPARGLALWLTIAMVAGCGAPVAGRPTRPAGTPEVSLWVLDHGWHTAIVLRRADIDPAWWPELEDFPSATLIEVAWGDRGFYMARPATAWMALKAAFGSGGSVLHLVGLDTPTAAAFPRSEIVELRITRPGLAALARFVSEEHQRDATGRSIRLGPGLYGSSGFYAARSRYSLNNTCNTWIARALQTAGLPVTPSGVITAGSLMEQLRSSRVSR